MNNSDYGNTQSKHGYPRTQSTNPNKPERKGQDMDRMPSIADGDPAGNKITTNYPLKQSSNPNTDAGSGEVDAQTLRGFVRNQPNFKPSTSNGNARRGMSDTISMIPAPSTPDNPTPSQVSAANSARGATGQAGD